MIPTTNWFQSRTLIWNIVSLAVLAVGLVVDAAGVLALDPKMVVYLGIVMAVGNAGLRLISASAIAGTPAAAAGAAPTPLLDTLPAA